MLRKPTSERLSRSSDGVFALLIKVLVLEVCRSSVAGARGASADQGLAMCHTLLTPFPVVSPGFLSFAQPYNGLPL